MRDILFVSHANPEDNQVALWLTLQLAANGYPAWCDLTKLLGGEDFWKDAEAAIRNRACKFLYVLSKTSNTKDGPRNELQIAVNVAKAQKIVDFIIPLHIDDLPHTETNVLLAKLIAIPFESGWAKGCQQLLAKLEKDAVLKSASFGPQAVASWWIKQFSTRRGVQQKPEQYLSNWFPIKSIPTVYLHTLRRSTIGPVEPEIDLGFPSFMDGIDLVTFATAKDLEGKLGSSTSVNSSRAFSFEELLRISRETTGLTIGKVHYYLSRLLRDAWDRWMIGFGLGRFDLSDRAACFFFKKGSSDNFDIHFTGLDGKRAYRSVVGYKTNPNGSKRYWHFGVDAQPVQYPVFGYRIASHVLFSDDGQRIWTDNRRMHKARRSQCKNWHNPEWRDRLLAVIAWLSKEQETIYIPVGEQARIELATQSVEFTSPVSFIDPPPLKERLAEFEVEDGEELGEEREEEGNEPDAEEDSQ